MIKAWKIAPGKGAEDWDLFRRHSCIGIGWLVKSDYRDYDGEPDLLTALEAEKGKGKQGYGSGAAKMIWQFVNDVKDNDVVVANKGFNRVVGIGVVTSEYLPPNSEQNPIRQDTTTHCHHVRLVNWLITDPIDLPGEQFFVLRTLWHLKTEKLKKIWQAYLKKYPAMKATLDQLDVGYRKPDSLLPQEIAPMAADAEETVVAAANGASQGKAGAGFGDPAENKLVESTAVRAVVKDYKSKGWSVRSVEHDKRGFDLECSKNGAVEQVEVKGVGGAAISFIITAGEVEQARSNTRFHLVVVTSALSASPTLTKFSGAEFCRQFDLSAIQYRAVLVR